MKRVLICSNYAWTVFNFRLSLIDVLLSEDINVDILTQFDGYEANFPESVGVVQDLWISRKGLNPFQDLITFLQIFWKIIRNRPDCCLFFTIKPVIYGSLAAKVCNVRSIVTITGLGTSFIADNWLTKIVKTLYRVVLTTPSVVIFQNKADEKLFIDERLVHHERTKVIPGSGIDLEKFSPQPMPSSKDKIVFLMVARLLKDKGVHEFAEAAALVGSVNPKIVFWLLGPLGVENRTAIDKELLDSWVDSRCITYLGETDNVVKYLGAAHCVVLPSYREGLSRVILEAAAMARPVITTNVPGCRDVIKHGINGYLCEPRSSKQLASRIIEMANLTDAAREQMGKAGRVLVEKDYSQRVVNKSYLDVLNSGF